MLDICEVITCPVTMIYVLLACKVATISHERRVLMAFPSPNISFMLPQGDNLVSNNGALKNPSQVHVEGVTQGNVLEPNLDKFHIEINEF
jgi:hypothetical protein